MDRLLYSVGLGALLCGLVIVLNVQTPWMSGAAVREELTKVAIQVLVFGMAGGGVKLLIDRQAERRRFRADMLERLGQAHKVVYRARRLLANCAPETSRELLGELMDARQELGATTHVIRASRSGGDSDAVRDAIAAMRGYLEAVITGALAAPDSPDRAAYAAFIDWQSETGSYNEVFKKLYEKAKELIDPKLKKQDEHELSARSARAKQ